MKEDGTGTNNRNLAAKIDSPDYSLDYSALVDKDFPIEYNDVFKDTETGQTYRVTSNPEEKPAPKSSTLPLKYFTAEKWSLTT